MLQDNKSASADKPFPTQTTPAMPPMDAHTLATAMDAATAAWHLAPTAGTQPDTVLALHRANYDLWHLEDSARDPHATPLQIAGTKRNIDRVNQTRNDFAETIDCALLDTLAAQGLPHPAASLHSETPGQILDRLSILSLKRFHTAQEAERPTATEAHRLRNRDRLATLDGQSSDLTNCLADLWADILAGRRRFKLYRQFKMYNDPDLNPVLYRNPPPGATEPVDSHNASTRSLDPAQPREYKR